MTTPQPSPAALARALPGRTRWPPALLLVLGGAVGPACHGPAPGDSAGAPADTQDSAAPAAAPLPFSPDRVLVRSILLPVGDATGFAWKPGGAAQDAQVLLSLLDHRWYLAEDPAWRCDWTGRLVDLGAIEASVEGAWTSRAVRLEQVETDCGASPAWNDGPADLLQVELALELGPIGGRSLPLLTLFADQPQTWPELQPYAVGIWLGPAGAPRELGYGFVHQLDGDQVLVREPQVQLLPLADGLPSGLLRGTAYGAERLEDVLP